MTLNEVMKELETYGSEQTKKTYLNHGAKEPIFGVKVGDMKKIVKKIKKDHELSLQLFATENSDAMYLAGLVADENKISKHDLQNWAAKAPWYYISEYAVAWIAAESKFGWELALEWIKSEKENIASSGWATLSNIIIITANEALNKDTISVLLDHVKNPIHSAQNRVRYTMNGFVIAVGSSIPELTEKAQRTAKIIGKVDVFMGKTSCKVPLATSYIKKVIDAGKLGYKKKNARC
jgi:3-methyladenine DNA glycosylase AlkD